MYICNGGDVAAVRKAVEIRLAVNQSVSQSVQSVKIARGFGGVEDGPVALDVQ